MIRLFRPVSLFLYGAVLCFCCSSCKSNPADSNNSGNNTVSTNWSSRADSSQSALTRHFWNSSQSLYYSTSDKGTDLNYWWQAHALDVLVDGYNRTSDSSYLQNISKLYNGISKKNSGFINNYFDDMEWMALALLRTYEKTGMSKYKSTVDLLWSDIKTGWNDNMGGGICWKKDQRDYKNTPANAPACILACRLYRNYGSSDDLAMAKKIYTWLTANLVDPVSGEVWDGINRQSNGQIDKGWQFTYCYGVYLGASLELYKIEKNKTYLDAAVKTADAAIKNLTRNNILKDEGEGDGGLFKGIFVRYLVQLILQPELDSALKEKYRNFITQNATSLWDKGKSSSDAVFNHDWTIVPGPSTHLSTQLSAVMLLEGKVLLK